MLCMYNSNIYIYLFFTFAKARNANGETGIFPDNTNGEVLSIETNLAFLATADDFRENAAQRKCKV